MGLWALSGDREIQCMKSIYSIWFFAPEVKFCRSFRCGRTETPQGNIRYT